MAEELIRPSYFELRAKQLTSLGSVTEETIDRFNELIEEGKELTRSDVLAEMLSELESEGRDVDGEITFDSSHDQARYETLRRTREREAEAHDELKALVGDAIRRVEFAQVARRLTIEDHRDRWDEARGEIRKLYDGFDLPPQVGLIPLGVNKQGCYEFTHLETQHRPGDGWIDSDEFTAESGIVFVLIPAGRGRIGHTLSEFEPEGLSNRSRTNLELYNPPRDVEFDRPFFLAKYELTEAQWNRMNRRQGGSVLPQGSILISRADELLARFGLRCPTEEEWEYAARAGERTPWRGADTIGELPNVEVRIGGTPQILIPGAEGKFVDVNYGDPNSFGLYGIGFNVRELTSSELDEDHRALCDGCNGAGPHDTRLAFRMFIPVELTTPWLGLRVAMDVRDRED